jgi:cyclase|tara:strand:- start:213 stop:1106 length:894 start_codon:yes stop_codon:yes gene_type:complete
MTKLLRIIPKLDIKGPNLIKGICYEGNRVLGHANYFSELYSKEGADEIFFHDTVASLYSRNNLLNVLSNSASNVNIPITVSGGIKSISDINKILRAGADKVAINSAAIKNIDLIKKATRKFGSQCIVGLIEAKRVKKNIYEPWYDFGREKSNKLLDEWCQKLLEAGVGEIFICSVDRDGTGFGFDFDLVEKILKYSNVPVVVCSGAGTNEDVLNLVKNYDCDGVGIGSMFHYNYLIKTNKKFMSYDSEELRMGKQVDSGNIDFIKNGYGGQFDIQVTPTSIRKLKKYLNKSKIKVRI